MYHLACNDSHMKISNRKNHYFYQRSFKILLLLLLFLATVFSLHAQSTITLHFDNVAGDRDIILNSGKYTNAVGEEFSVSILQYFISNIQLTSVDGKQFTVPQDSSYFFVQEDDSLSQQCTIHVPPGQYKSVSFVVGIDSLRSVSKIDRRMGVLDPSATNMYWGWNSGYIFLKMEGISAAAPEDAIGLRKYRYHIGGFGGYNSPTINNIKNIHLDLSNEGLEVKENNKASIFIKADVLKIFSGQSSLSIAEHYSIMFDTFSINVAGNYASMFSIAAIEN